jgi:hypothetical protein
MGEMEVFSMRKKLLLLFFCITGFTALPLFGMKRAQTFFSATKPLFIKEAIKNKYSQTWRNTATATKWGLAFAPTIHSGYKWAKSYFSDYANPDPEKLASPSVTKLPHKELEKQGMKNPHTVNILLHNGTNSAFHNKNTKEISINYVAQADIELNILKSKLDKLLQEETPSLEKIKYYVENTKTIYKVFDKQLSKETNTVIQDDWNYYFQQKQYSKKLYKNIKNLYYSLLSHKTKKIIKEKKKLKTILAEQPIAKEKIPLRHKELLQHESAHLIKNHTPKTIFSSLVIPAMTAFCYHLLPTNKLIWWKHLIYEPLHGLVLAGTNKLLYHAYERYQEQEADNAIENNIKTLQAAFECRKRWYENEEKENNESIYEHLVSTHPTHLSRAQKLEKRIEILKKQQQQEEEKNKILLKKTNFF